MYVFINKKTKSTKNADIHIFFLYRCYFWDQADKLSGECELNEKMEEKKTLTARLVDWSIVGFLSVYFVAKSVEQCKK